MVYKYKILSIDGGGIRGLIPAMVLTEIERRTGKSIAECFDLIAGTSTGGILSLGLTKPGPRDLQQPHYRAKDLVELYRTQGKRIFQEAFPGKLDELLFNPKHCSTGKEQVMSEYFGDIGIDAALTDIFITSYDTQLRKPIFFTSNRAAEECGSKNFSKIGSGFTMHQAAMATSAAPTFFEPYRIATVHPEVDSGFYCLIDGAAYANNPALLATLEARMTYRRRYQQELHLHNMLIVSLGTGSLIHRFPYEEVKRWGKLQWIQPFIHITFDGQTEAIDSQLSSFLGGAGGSRNYYRFQTALDEEQNAMDDASDANLDKIMAIGSRLIQEKSACLDQLCEYL